jgi:ankyrin repeat protein
MLAAQNDCGGVARLLLAAGAQLDLREQHGWSALVFAAQNDASDVCCALLEAGAEVGVCARITQNP